MQQKWKQKYNPPYDHNIILAFKNSDDQLHNSVVSTLFIGVWHYSHLLPKEVNRKKWLQQVVSRANLQPVWVHVILDPVQSRSIMWSCDGSCNASIWKTSFLSQE